MQREIVWFDSIEAEVDGDIIRFTGHSGERTMYSCVTRAAGVKYAYAILRAVEQADMAEIANAEVLPFARAG